MKIKILELLIVISFSFQLNPEHVKNQLLIIPYPQEVKANFGNRTAVEISPSVKLSIADKSQTKLRKGKEVNAVCDDACKDFLNDNFNFSVISTLNSQKGLKDFRLSLHKKLDIDHIEPDIKYTIKTVKVKLEGETVFPKLKIGIPEDYSLIINTNEISITATNVYGARHAFETLSQLIRIYDSKNKFVITQLPIEIKDFPRFRWRGILVDPVRNVFDPSMFKKIVDALAMLKNNIIHLHLSDGQAFLFEVKGYPNLATKGTPHQTKIFTQAFIKELVDYGRKRGVMIYGEIDIPGHSASWNLGYPGVVSDMWDYIVKRNSNYGENMPAISPIYPETENILKQVAKELGEAFDFDYVHIGGDEVNKVAWENSTEAQQIKEFMDEKGFKDSMDLEGYLSKIAQEEIMRNNKKPILFEEIFDHGFAEKGSVIHVWNDPGLFDDTLSQGYEIIISTPYYVDKQMPNCKGGDPKSCEITHNRWAWTYRDMYEWEPSDYIKDEYMDKVLGFEGCSWDESCDRQNFFDRGFQRYFGIAERMWSPSKMTKSLSAEIRGSYFRCLGLRRDILTGAGPISPSLCDLPAKSDDN